LNPVKSVGYTSYLNQKCTDAFSSIYSDPSNVDEDEDDDFEKELLFSNYQNINLLSEEKRRKSKKSFNPIAFISRPKCCVGDGPIRSSLKAINSNLSPPPCELSDKDFISILNNKKTYKEVLNSNKVVFASINSIKPITDLMPASSPEFSTKKYK